MTHDSLSKDLGKFVSSARDFSCSLFDLIAANARDYFFLLHGESSKSVSLSRNFKMFVKSRRNKTLKRTKFNFVLRVYNNNTCNRACLRLETAE